VKAKNKKAGGNALFAVILLLFPLLFLGCTQERQARDDRTVLHLWTWHTEHIDAYKELFGIFEYENPDIRIIHTTHPCAAYDAALLAALNAGDGPDIFQSRAYGKLKALARAGHIQALENHVPYLADFPQMTLRAITYGGGIYGVPFATETLLVFYNRDIYQKLGLDVPASWEQFLANCEVIRRAGITPISNGGADAWTLEIMMGTFSPNFYGANHFFRRVTKGETDFTDPAFTAAIGRLNYLRPHMPDRFMGIGHNDALSLFYNETAAHFVGRSSEARFFKSQNPSLNFGIFAPPALTAGGQNYVSIYTYGVFGMNSASANKEAAARFLNFLAGKTAGEFFMDTLKQVSPVPGVDVLHRPLIAQIISMQEHSTPFIFLAGFSYGEPTGSRLAQAALQGMFAGQLNSAQVSQQIQEGLATQKK